MRARMQSLSGSDPGPDGQPQWYQDWCSSSQEGYGSGGSPDELLPVQYVGCNDSFFSVEDTAECARMMAQRQRHDDSVLLR